VGKEWVQKVLGDGGAGPFAAEETIPFKCDSTTWCSIENKPNVPIKKDGLGGTVSVQQGGWNKIMLTWKMA